jgi:hypothetical protein
MSTMVSSSSSSSSGTHYNAYEGQLVANTSADTKLTREEATALFNTAVGTYVPAGTNLEALYQERMKGYAELSSRYDPNFKDTTEHAEMSGGAIEGGTWEHRKRAKEMMETAARNLELTARSAGRHIGEYLPQSELDKFMKKAQTLAAGGTVIAENDYESSKLTASNVGYQMLQRSGWIEGAGLGTGTGITAPVNMASSGPSNAGIGMQNGQDLNSGDDDFEQYRKRMMLSYKYRPNPLNNPRRSYY